LTETITARFISLFRMFLLVPAAYSQLQKCSITAIFCHVFHKRKPILTSLFCKIQAEMASLSENGHITKS